MQPAPAGPAFPDLRDLRSVLDRIYRDKLVAPREGPPRTERRVCARRPILRSCLDSYFLIISNLSALICRLNNDPALRSVFGFTGRLPSYATFWRACEQLAGMPKLIDRCGDDIRDQLRKLLPDLG